MWQCRRRRHRAIEVQATRLPLFSGAQMAVDITLRCALTADGTAQPRAARVDGAVFTKAREDKDRTYSELLRRGDRCRLVVDALKTGGKMVRGSPSVRGSVGGDGGLGCFQCHALVPSPVRWWPCPLCCMPLAEPTGAPLIWQIFLVSRGNSQLSGTSFSHHSKRRHQQETCVHWRK